MNVDSISLLLLSPISNDKGVFRMLNSTGLFGYEDPMATWDGACWMKDLSGRIGNLPLATLSLVGTHNSASASISFESDVAPDCPVDIPMGDQPTFTPPPSPSERVFGKLSAVKRKLMLRVAAVWARNQSRSVAEQLRLGVRYLDLRVAPNHARGGGLYITHGLFACSLEEVCTAIRDFAVENPQEVVVVDFQHLLHFTQPLSSDTISSMDSLRNALRDILGPVATDAALVGPHSTLNAIWETKRSLMVVVPDYSVKYLPPFVRPRSTTVVSTWHNAQTVDALIKTAHEEAVKGRLEHAARLAVATAQNATPTPMPMFVTQGVLTPEAFEVAVGVARLGPSSVKHLANTVNAHVTRYYAATCASSTGPLPLRQASATNFKKYRLRETALCGCSPDEGSDKCAWCVHNCHRNILMLDYVETAKILAQCSGAVKAPTVATSPKLGLLERLTVPKDPTINKQCPHFISAIDMCIHINLRRAAEMDSPPTAALTKPIA